MSRENFVKGKKESLLTRWTHCVQWTAAIALTGGRNGKKHMIPAVWGPASKSSRRPLPESITLVWLPSSGCWLIAASQWRLLSFYDDDRRRPADRSIDAPESRCGGRQNGGSVSLCAGFKFIGFFGESFNLGQQRDGKWEREIIKEKEMDGRDGDISNEIFFSRQPLRQIERKREKWWRVGERERGDFGSLFYSPRAGNG